MAAAPALAWLWATATQLSNDAYVSQSFATGLYGQTGIAYQVRELQIEIPGPLEVDSVSYEIAIGIKSLAAMPNISDKSVLYRRKRTIKFGTSGVFYWENVIREVFSSDESFYLVSDPAYLMFDTNATSASNTCYVKIGYQVVKLADVDRLTLLAASLT
jgi:hypothetical protein